MATLHISEVIRQFLAKSRLRDGVQAARIEEIWEKIMGKTIAQYTTRIQIIHHKLFIETHVGPLKQELMYQKPQIISRVNEAFGEEVVKEVIIQYIDLLPIFSGFVSEKSAYPNNTYINFFNYVCKLLFIFFGNIKQSG